MVRLVRLAGVVALAVVLLAGCGGGGGNDPAKVEANLRQYLTGLPAEGAGFPWGWGRRR